MPQRAFLDTSFAIALSSVTDKHHSQAKAIADRLQSENAQLVTTHAVLFEIGNAMAKSRFRDAAVILLEALTNDPRITLIPVTQSLYSEAFALFRQRDDKAWGLTDCLSFVVMRAEGITDALTADDHFRQAGFKALLLE